MYNDGIIYAQVLLLDNKIEAWKICQTQKRSPYDFKACWKQNRFDDYTMDTFCFLKEETYIEDGWNFNSYVYGVIAPEWINQWEYADDYKGSKATVQNLEEAIEDMQKFEDALNGEFCMIKTIRRN